MSSKRLEKKTDQIKRENLQQTKNSNIEKKSNIKTIKKLQEEKDTLEKQMTDLKTLNLHLQQIYTDNKIRKYSRQNSWQ